MTQEAISEILTQFFELLCKCLKQPLPSDPATSQQERDVLAMELVMLFRLLLSSESEGSLARDCTNALLNSVLDNKYKAAENLASTLPSSRTKPVKSVEPPEGVTMRKTTDETPEEQQKTRLLGMLYVLGGQRDVLRVGGRVGLPAKYGTEGTIQGKLSYSKHCITIFQHTRPHLIW